jgi:CheY-like chemotaxis protein
VTCGTDVPSVQADATHIHQVLINLGTNAWQAMEGRRGRIEIRLDGITLDSDAARQAGGLPPGRYCRLAVTDSGIGMGDETLQRIFDPFFTTKPVGQGTGLGLSVVHGTMKAHGGAVTVKSKPGQGSTFSLYFPAAEPAETSGPAAAVVAGARSDGAGRHVLYLDDEESLVFLVSRLLKRQGYRVSGFTRADEALAALRADPGKFDLVVTDLNMPGASGLDVAREVARLRPDLPVVLTSGSINDELKALAPLAGVRELIYKPNTVEELCEVVGRLAGANAK